MTKGRLIVISGPSGAGKGTIVASLMERDESLEFSVSMTTRAMREGEVDGVSYFFVSHEAFEELIEKEGFLEYAKVYDNYYGTPKEQILDRLALGKNVLLDIDTQGAANVKAAYPEAVTIFVLPPSLEELRRRIEGRATDSPEVIEGRLQKALSEIRLAGNYDHVVINDDLSEAVAAIEAILAGEDVPKRNVEQLIAQYEEEEHAISIHQ